MRVRRNEAEGRVLLGDKRGGGAVMWRPIRFHCVGVYVSAGLPYNYTHPWPRACFNPTCDGPSGMGVFLKAPQHSFLPHHSSSSPINSTPLRRRREVKMNRQYDTEPASRWLQMCLSGSALSCSHSTNLFSSPVRPDAWCKPHKTPRNSPPPLNSESHTDL